MISPMGLGDTSPFLDSTFIDDTGAVVPLTGLVGTNIVLNILQNGIVTQGAGTWQIVGSGSTGEAIYHWVAADTAKAGSRLIWPTVMTANGPQHFDAQPQLILPY